MSIMNFISYDVTHTKIIRKIINNNIPGFEFENLKRKNTEYNI